MNNFGGLNKNLFYSEKYLSRLLKLSGPIFETKDTDQQVNWNKAKKGGGNYAASHPRK